MKFLQMFRQPYLDADTDIGGSAPNEPIPNESAPEGNPDPAPQPNDDTQPKVEKIKVKYNHEEMEIPYEEAVVHIQKGMNYEKAIEKAKQEYDSKIAQLFGDEYGIKTFDDYLNAIQEQREQDRINKLVEQNIPEEYAKELIESKKFREQYESEIRQKQEETKRIEELKEFQSEYPDVKLDEIPKEVFEQVGNGRTLLDAYSRYEVKVLKDQLNQLKKLQENAQSSTGSVAGNGNVPDDFISEDVFEAKKNDRNWVIKNLEKITKSRSKW